jgi:hypothetical protein
MEKLIRICKNNKTIAFLFIAMMLVVNVYGQNSKPVSDSMQKEWWYPIVKKHKIDMKQFNVYGNVLIIGNNISNEDSLITCKEALVLINCVKEYSFYKTTSVSYDIKKALITINKCSVNRYYKDLVITRDPHSDTIEPYQTSDGMAYQIDLKKNSVIEMVKK